VTVPSGCKAAVFTWSYYNAASGHGLASATLNGAAPDATAEIATQIGGSDAPATGIAVFLNPASGSQTFAHSFDAATTEGPARALTFLTADGAIAVRGSLGVDSDFSSNAASVALTGLTAGDLVVAMDQKFAADPANQSGWTSLLTGNVNNEHFRVRSIAASGSSVTATAQGPNYSSIAAGAFYDAGVASPTITDVDTDEIVLDGQTSVAVTGTAMGTTNADRAFTLRQASTSVPQTETGTGTATAATLTIVTEQSGADIKFGAATLRATRTSDSAFGELAITVNPPSGQLYVDVGTPNATAANRITAVADIASGDQIQYRGVGGGSAPTGLTINTDATWQFSSGNTPASFDVRVWDASDATWGAWATQSVGAISLTVNDATHGHAVDAPALSQANTLTSNDGLHGHAADSPSLTQGHVLSSNEATHGHAVESPTLTQATVLSADEAAHGHTADSPALAQANVLTAHDATHAHLADVLDLIQANVLEVDDALHAQLADSPTLLAGFALSVSEATHGHLAESVSLIQARTLSVDEAAHATSADSPTLSTELNLAVADSSHGHAADAVTLIQAHVLDMDDATHGHTVEQVALSFGFTVTVADALHAQLADSPTLTVGYVLAVASALHLHEAGVVDLTQAGTLIVSDALHAHLADTVALRRPGAVDAETVFVVRSQQRTYIVASATRIHTVH
jgi:hypothetical protein